MIKTAKICLPHTEETLSQFLKYVDIKDGCWNWLGGYNKGGYGLFWNFLAHRVSYYLASSKSLLAGEVVMHRCNNSACVNPAHLKAGTQLENLSTVKRKSGVTYDRRLHNMNSIHTQAWIPASQVCLIAEYLDKSGVKTRVMADILRTAIEYACDAVIKKGLMKRDEAGAILYLEKLGYALDTSKRYKRSAIKLLQEEALSDIDISEDKMILGMSAEDLDRLINSQSAAELTTSEKVADNKGT